MAAASCYLGRGYHTNVGVQTVPAFPVRLRACNANVRAPRAQTPAGSLVLLVVWGWVPYLFRCLRS